MKLIATSPPCDRAPGRFLLQTVRAFRANQGLLLAGAVAYYALLSIVPLLILIVIALSHVIEEASLLSTIGRYLEWLTPGQSRAITAELGNFLAHRDFIGWVLLATMLFFSSLAFTVLESAMSIIFLHRVAKRRRHFLVSALLPYGYILTLGAGLLLVTLVAGGLQVMGEESLELFGYEWSLSGFSACCCTAGFRRRSVRADSVTGDAGRALALRHALIGGITAAVLWEITRHLLVWYFSSLSTVSVVYGSLTTAIVVLLSLEIAAGLLLFGAQVISEYERIEAGGKEEQAPQPLRTD